MVIIRPKFSWVCNKCYEWFSYGDDKPPKKCPDCKKGFLVKTCGDCGEDFDKCKCK